MMASIANLCVHAHFTISSWHLQARQSKFRVPVLMAVPSWPKPPPAGDLHSAEWYRRANRFAEFALAVFWPWPAPGTKDRFAFVTDPSSGSQPCEAWEMFAWKLAELNASETRYNAELLRIATLSLSEARDEAARFRTTP